MSKASIVFAFTDPSQFVPLTGSNAGSGYCLPLLAVTDNAGGDLSVSGATPNSPLPSSLMIGNVAYAAYPSQGAGPTPTTLTVGRNKQPDLAFSIVVPDPANPGPPQRYIPATSYALVGLALKKLSGGGLDLTTFPGLQVSVSGGVTKLEINDKNSGPGNSSTTYDFWVMVQNAAGDVGLIDPLITNQD